MNRFKITLVLAILAVGLLDGCAGPQYIKSGVDSATAQRDANECQMEALKATASAPGGSILYNPSTTLANDIAIGIRQNDIIRNCLALRGYRSI